MALQAKDITIAVVDKSSTANSDTSAIVLTNEPACKALYTVDIAR